MGFPKGGNTYGNGAPIVDYKIEGGQLIFNPNYHATKNGVEMLRIINDSKPNAIQNVYQILFDRKLYYYCY